MCCNGADLQTYKDFGQGITKEYYNIKYAIFGLEGWINPQLVVVKVLKLLN